MVQPFSAGYTMRGSGHQAEVVCVQIADLSLTYGSPAATLTSIVATIGLPVAGEFSSERAHIDSDMANSRGALVMRIRDPLVL